MKRATRFITSLYPLLALLGLLALLSGCAGRPAQPPAASMPMPPAGQEARVTVVESAHRMIGAPYRPGGNSPRGFDCSGLVSYSHGHAGIPVPRTAAEQFARARPIGRRDLLPGDLVFFKTAGRRVSHVGIYVGQGRFVHAPSTGKQVALESLDNPYWRRRIIGAGHYF
jgi:cell wall-associated NlpC family hydrolase